MIWTVALFATTKVTSSASCCHHAIHPDWRRNTSWCWTYLCAESTAEPFPDRTAVTLALAFILRKIASTALDHFFFCTAGIFCPRDPVWFSEGITCIQLATASFTAHDIYSSPPYLPCGSGLTRG
ncbi:hypothetical protein J3F83DRAFT_520989 [Trichoderma novae-zelandiae]